MREGTFLLVAYTPLHIAAQNGNLDVVNALIAADAKVDQPDKNGTNALDIATHHKHQEIVKVLKNYQNNI